MRSSTGNFATRLVIKSPEKRCGKSRLLEVLRYTCSGSLPTSNTSAAAIYRSIGILEPRPTLLLDEADTVFGSKFVAEKNEELRGIFNAGFSRGGYVLRVEGQNHTPAQFDTFAMVAIAGIGSLPDTIEDRAILITMRRRIGSESVASFRLGVDVPTLEAVRDRIGAWVASCSDAFDAIPDVAPLEDRAADKWEPLLVVADAAGGHWPKRARSAAIALEALAADIAAEASLSTQLLADIRSVFDREANVSFLPSSLLVNKLKELPDSAWESINLNPSRVADYLRPYGIKPHHSPAGDARGYQRVKLEDAFNRYLPEPVDPDQVQPSPTVSPSQP